MSNSNPRPGLVNVTGTGRNDPCPCGSGKKYKHCCAVTGPALGPRGGGLPGKFAPLPATAASGHASTTKQQPKAAEESRLRGIQLMSVGRYAEAAVVLRNAVQLDPGRAASHHALGTALLKSGQLPAAETSLREAIALDPKLAGAYLDLGVVLDSQGRDLGALQAYSRAVSLSPKLSDIHRRIGELWQARGPTDEAIAAYHRGAAAARDTSEGRLLHARALMLEGKIEETEQVLRRLVALDRNNGKAEAALADVLSIQGQFAEAIRHYDRALAIDPRGSSSWLSIARAMKFAEADRPRLAAMQSALALDGLTDKQRMALHFAIGKACDDLQDYQDAMRHFDAANGIRGLNARFDQAGFTDYVDRMIKRFTPELFAERAALGTADETPLLIVGMPRSGTTLVEQIVSSHPTIAAGEELVYWTSLAVPQETADTADFTPESARALATAYLGVLRRIGGAASRVTDKMPFNFMRLGLIHLLLPNARIIHCRRNPIDTCLSIYATLFDGRIDFAASKAALALYYRQYARLMGHWRAVLPPNRFTEVQYGELIGNREAETKRLIAFAGLDWDEACLLPERNDRVVKTASVWQARQPVYASSVERWRRYEPWLGELATLAE
jgi:tetratricopeptide (TPR) repeat protein